MPKVSRILLISEINAARIGRFICLGLGLASYIYFENGHFPQNFYFSDAGGFIKSGSIYTIEHKGGRSCGASKFDLSKSYIDFSTINCND